MSYSKVQKIYPTANTGAVDYGVTTVSYTWQPAENMVVYGWGLQHTEATHTTTITTSAVINFAYDAANAGTTATKGTIAVGAGKTIGGEQVDYVTPFKVTGSSDSLEWTTTTAIAGTATTGTAVPFVYAEVFPAATGE